LLQAHLLDNIVPQLPSSLHDSLTKALNRDRIRKMPNSFLPPSPQDTKEGVILLGDSWNMRHPLTGGGMTVAFNDVVTLVQLLEGVEDLSNWEEIKEVLSAWWWKRKGYGATINILSVALYDLFGADRKASFYIQSL
jgi:squalene monooxygenase